MEVCGVVLLRASLTGRWWGEGFVLGDGDDDDDDDSSGGGGGEGILYLFSAGWI